MIACAPPVRGGDALEVKQDRRAGQESACGWRKDRWGISWQITPRVLTDAMAAGGPEAKHAFAAMMEMGKIDIAKIEAALRG
jgi:2-polyprenyl-6-hydroxyphenyl methylase/3-demethylubiquinone-9 3-methyltransferase